jgi:peptidoglycan/xylan/chitin deacetylase (PgdA/CDA1 family)
MNDFSTFLSDDAFAIFLFHGVIPQQRHHIRNYTVKHLARERFAAILRDLDDHGNAVSLPDIVQATVNGKKLPKRAFAITFDDGFENNYSVAAPVLDDFRVPAMFYVTTGFIESNGSSWIDLIEYSVEQAEKFQLSLTHAELCGTYNSREEKIELLNRIRQVVKNDASIDPYEFAAEVSRQIGVRMEEPDPDLDQKMSWTQVRKLAENCLFTIGGHSHTHRILEYLSQSELEDEISLSLEKLKTNLDAPIEHYSYPEGLAHCYSDRVIGALRGRGIVCAPSAEHGINRVGDNLFHLKRIMVT